jgi:hypothetical protein
VAVPVKPCAGVNVSTYAPAADRATAVPPAFAGDSESTSAPVNGPPVAPSVRSTCTGVPAGVVAWCAPAPGGGVAASAIASVQDCVPVSPCASVAVTVNACLPLSVGVPDSAPPVDSTSPAGRLPLETAKLYGAVPPLACSACAYAAPTWPSGSDAGDSTIVGAMTCNT